MKALVNLALAVAEKQKAASSLSPIVKLALKKHKEKTEEDSSDAIVELLRLIEDSRVNGVAELRRLKIQQKAIKAGLDDLDRRWAFGEATANFVPVLAFFNKVKPSDFANKSDFEELSSVPSDWRPSPLKVPGDVQEIDLSTK